MDWHTRIEVNPEVLVGKPVIRGTRIAVEFIIELLGEGWTEAQVLENYPQLKHDDILAALQYTTQLLKEEQVYSLP
jgi:uncharacterized protein (DUF433 family)